MERTLYNGVLGAMVPDGSWWMHVNPTPLAGPSSKERAREQMSGFGEDCCLAQGPKALAMAPWVAVMQDAGGPVINLYESAEASVELADGTVKISINGDFPVSGDVNIIVTPAAKNSKFSVKLRIPAWSRKTSVSVNERNYAGAPGSYLSIERVWSPGDVIKLNFDMSVQINEAPDGGGRVALTRGPIVLAQDSRLSKVDAPVSTDKLDAAVIEKNPRENIFMSCRLSDGTVLCDYASGGNEFSENNKLCVWMKCASK